MKKNIQNSVFVVEGGWNYEGSFVIGIFTTEKRAENCKRIALLDPDKGYDVVTVTEIKLNHRRI